MAERGRLPELTAEQRRANLERALEARKGAAAVKADLRQGRIGLAEALADPRAKRVRVSAMLGQLSSVGPSRAAAMMAWAGVAANRRCGGLGARQLEKLVEVAGR